MSTSVRPEPIEPDLLAKARLKVAEARKRGFSDADIDAYLQDEIGASLKDVTKPNERDFWRTVGSGVTLGFGDELAGLMSKLGGGSYAHARDAAREESAAFRATSPKASIGTELVSGGLPALLTTPVFGPAGWLGRMGRAGAAAAGVGAVSGAGHSEGETAGDVAKDAGKSALISAAVGSLLSGAGSVVGAGARRVRDAVDPSRPIIREAATQLPGNAAQTIARQESLAPGTAVLADVSPEMQALTRGVGADARAGVAARTAAEGRTSALRDARRSMGPQYDALNRVLPIDDELRSALADAGRKNILKSNATEVEFSAIQRVRSQLRAEARATRNDSVKLDKLKAADRLTAWMKQHAPEIEQLDADYAFLTDRAKAAGASAREITNSSKNYAASRAYGSEAGSIGGSLPQGSRGMMDLVAALARPNRASRARAVEKLLLTPGDATETALRRIQQARGAMDRPPSAILPLLQAQLHGNAVPGLLNVP